VVLFVGIDWAEDHHDVCVMAPDGEVVGKGRVSDGIEGVRRIHDLVAKASPDVDEAEPEVVVGIETDRGLLVRALLASGYEVIAVNPMAAARYRERFFVSGAKSDAADARVLADLVRTDRHQHRSVAGDSELAEQVKLVARSHQGAIWSRRRLGNQLRASLREYFPAILTIGDPLDRDVLAILAVAPTPAEARGLSRSKLAAALRRGGRQVNVEARAVEYQEILRRPVLEQPPRLASTYGQIARSLVEVIVATTGQIAYLEEVLTEDFSGHPDADIFRSLPGLGIVTGARVLGELGDDPERYVSAKARKNAAGTSPLTVASGTRRVVRARHVRNDRLADALYWWAFNAITRSPGARALYDQRRQAGDAHSQALRVVANRLVGILHGCLKTHTLYDEDRAWAHRMPSAA
jgi:transposase